MSLKTIISRYSSYSPESLRVVRYEDIESDPTGVIHDLAGFLECEISSGDTESISSRYSRENVKSLVSETDAALEHKIRNNEKVQANEIVRLTPSNYRALDLETGFQTGHVSNRKSGEWRSSFSQSEITRIIEVLDAAVTDLGYPSEMK